MFNNDEYNYLINKYRQLHYRTTDDPDEWEHFAEEEDEVRLQIYDLLVGNLFFKEVKNRLVTE